MKKTVLLIFVSVLMAFSHAGFVMSQVVIPNPNSYPEAVPLSAAEQEQLGKLMPRTMHLLESSTPTNKKKVKIAIYGQSLSDGNNMWWQTLRDALKTTYPNADIEVNCLGIGGVASQMLWRMTYHDMAAYYPDLVIFHVYGSHIVYENIIRFIRGCTTSEILIQGDHFGANDGSGTGCDWSYDLNSDAWDNRMSFQFIKGYCDKYGLERDNRRQEWYDYLKENCYTPSSGTLLKDNDDIHFGAQGEYLVSALTARHFKYDAEADHDPNKMVTVYKAGTDFTVADDAINLSIDGNRVDVITENGNGSESITTLIDSKKPSEFPGSYINTRVGNYWGGGCALMSIGSNPAPQAETWTLQIDNQRRYTLTGSKTGEDGSGNQTTRFESNSGSVVFRGADWANNPSNRTITFETKFYGKDQHTLPTTQSGANENLVTLAQGIPSSQHNLTLSGAVGKVKEIRVYRPAYKLKMESGVNSLDFYKDKRSKTVSVTSNSYWQVYNRVDWIKVDGLDNYDGKNETDRDGSVLESKSITISVDENDTNAPRVGTVTLVGIGVEPIVLTINQSDIEAVPHDIVIENGTSNVAQAKDGDVVSISPDVVPGKLFAKWTGDVETVANVNASNTTFVMPDKAVSLAATYKLIEYRVTVRGGTSDVSKAAMGETVTITAAAPKTGYAFDKWVGDVESVTDINLAETTLIMPIGNVILEATYKNVIGVERSAAAIVGIYPNPTADVLYLTGVSDADVAITDLFGSVLVSIGGYNGSSIDVSDLPAGLYIVRVGDFAATFIKK